MRELIRHCRLGDVELLAFGDAENDVDLLQRTDRGIAVANAIPALKAVATEVIGPNTEDSVAHYIQMDWLRRQRFASSADQLRGENQACAGDQAYGANQVHAAQRPRARDQTLEMGAD